MSWEKSRDFGVVKVEGKRVKLYTSKDNYGAIALTEEIKDARWSGGALLIYLNNGKIRRYTSFDNYSIL